MSKRKSAITPLSLLLTLILLGICYFGRNNHSETKSKVAEIAEQLTNGNTRKQPSTAAKAQNSLSARPSGATNADEEVGLPAPLTDRPEQILRRTGYVASYNKTLRLPNWVAWHLTSEHVDGPYKRNGQKFLPDTDVPEPRADTYDFMQTGYDRGHMCPSADNRWSPEAQHDCFLLSNICPQNHNLNAGDWSEMEKQCRNWAKDFGDIYIVCGPILFRSKHKTIGDHHVTVPEAFFKVVLCLKGEPKAIGFIYRNAEGNRPKGDYVNSVDEVERITGIDFFASLPDPVENAIEKEADLSSWY